MKRWNVEAMLGIGRQLFAKIHKKKHFANHNHDVHLMARELDEWLVDGVNSMIDGSYTPRFLKRHYFVDEMVDQLHLSDRIFQHILLKQLKPTFPYVMNPNCYHLSGPNGVKRATQRIREVLSEQNPQFIIRADIKSFYKSIQHHLLKQDIRSHYDDPNVQAMLEQIITNPIETPRGYKNADNGIALRGPLSQFFSGLFLKPLDDAFDSMGVTYIRYQDDVLILAKTKRQLNRCRRRMMEILHQRRLSLAGKKTYIGAIDKGFHFLGVHYPGTQPLDNITTTPVIDAPVKQDVSAYYLNSLGGGETISSLAIENQSPGLARIVPHSRTLRRAREQVKVMVFTGFSARLIRAYLHRWISWWVTTADKAWEYEEVLGWFLSACMDESAATHATALLAQYRVKKLRTVVALHQDPVEA